MRYVIASILFCQILCSKRLREKCSYPRSTAVSRSIYIDDDMKDIKSLRRPGLFVCNYPIMTVFALTVDTVQ